VISVLFLCLNLFIFQIWIFWVIRTACKLIFWKINLIWKFLKKIIFRITGPGLEAAGPANRAGRVARRRRPLPWLLAAAVVRHPGPPLPWPWRPWLVVERRRRRLGFSKTLARAPRAFRPDGLRPVVSTSPLVFGFWVAHDPNPNLHNYLFSINFQI